MNFIAGCSSCSDNSLKKKQHAFFKSSYQLEGFYEDYEEQDISIWIDTGVEGRQEHKSILTESCITMNQHNDSCFTYDDF